MLWEILLSATIEAMLGLLAETGLGETLRDLREAWAHTDARRRRRALEQALHQAIQAAQDEEVRPLLEHRPFQEEVVRALLDPERPFDVRALAGHWGARFPQHAPALQRFFAALQNALLADATWGPVLARYQTLRWREEVQKALREHALPTEATLVPAVARALSAYQAHLEGDGAIAQGPGAKAVGAGGLLVEGDYHALVQVVIQQFGSSGGNETTGSDLRRRYLQRVAREANVLPWTLLTRDVADPAQGEDLRLADVYIDLDTTELRHVEREEDLRRYLREVQPQAERVPVQEMVNRYAKLLIMGDPGSGKSTLVKHLTYLLAQAGLAEDPTPWLDRLGDRQHGLLLPVRVELRRLAAWAGPRAHGEADLLLGYLRHTWEEQGLAGFWEPFLEGLHAESPTTLFLLDGLDEVPTAQRQMVVDTVNALADLYPEQRYVVTCRPYAYVGQPWRLNGFHEVTLAPFDKDQIARFVTNWYTQLARRGRIREDEAHDKARSLQRAVARRDLRGLAERPLLLTVMAQLHAYRGKLPDDRTQLYADAVDLLLERWESRVDGEGILERLAIPGLKMSDLKSGLYEVAYRAHSLAAAGDEVAADIPQASLRAWLAPYLGGDWNKAGEFVDYIRERAGLLIRHKTEAYTFPHRSFQEFLAAAHWLSWPDYPSQAAAKVREDWDRWREVFVLSAGYAARTERLGLALAAVNALLPEEAPPQRPPGEAEMRTALLAAEALAEIGLVGVQREGVGRAVLARTQRWLLAGLTAETLPARQRAEAGRSLGHIGDPRTGVLEVDEMPFAFVPAGPFLMGSPEGEGREAEQPQHEVTLPAYWMACYPVTNAQFAAFVDDGGYARADLWPEARAAGVWRDGRVKAWNDDEPRDRPYDFGAPFNLSNHPVVGITWYEALAFVRWLTHRWQAQGWLPRGWRVALPSEAEWEKAARGGMAIPREAFLTSPANPAARPDLPLEPNPLPWRRYPWGDAFDPARANTNEAGLGTTSAVGAFPRWASPYGVLDLSGNVWEWTRSIPKDYPYDPDDGREDLQAAALRVLRGGSFNSGPGNARAAVRDWSPPVLRYGHSGFRVGVVPVSAASER